MYTYLRLYTEFIGSCQNTVAVDHAGYYRSLNQIVMIIFPLLQGLGRHQYVRLHGVRRRVPPFGWSKRRPLWQRAGSEDVQLHVRCAAAAAAASAPHP